MNAASAGRPCERRDPYAVPERQAIAVTAPAVILSFLFRGMTRHSTPRLPVSCAAGMLLNIPGCKALNGRGERCLDGLLASLFLPSSLLPMHYLSSHSRNWKT